MYAEQALHSKNIIIDQEGWVSSLGGHHMLRRLMMKLLSYLCAWVLILGYQGVMLSFAGELERNSALLLSQQGVQAQSAEMERAATQFQNVEGMLKEIQGNIYVVEREATHQPIRVEIGKDTAFPNGQKEPGQMLQALISTSDGHALIIR